MFLLKMHQLKKNPPKFENDLKWPTCRANSKKLKLFTVKGA